MIPISIGHYTIAPIDLVESGEVICYPTHYSGGEVICYLHVSQVHPWPMYTDMSKHAHLENVYISGESCMIQHEVERLTY